MYGISYVDIFCNNNTDKIRIEKRKSYCVIMRKAMYRAKGKQGWSII